MAGVDWNRVAPLFVAAAALTTKMFHLEQSTRIEHNKPTTGQAGPNNEATQPATDVRSLVAPALRSRIKHQEQKASLSRPTKRRVGRLLFNTKGRLTKKKKKKKCK